MNFSYENQDDKKLLVYHVQDDDLIDTSAFGIMLNRQIDGMTSFVFLRNDLGSFLKYDISNSICLNEYLSGVVCKKMFIDFFINMILALLKYNSLFNSTNTLVAIPEYVYLNKNTNEIFLVCLPLVVKNEKVDDLREFFKQVVFNIMFDANEDCTYVSNIISFLNRVDEFLMNDFKNLIESLNISDQADITKLDNLEDYECSNCGARIERDFIFCSKCGIEVNCEEENFSLNINEQLIDTNDSQQNEQQGLFNEQIVPNISGNEIEEQRNEVISSAVYGETTLLGLGNIGETTVLSSDALNVNLPFIIRKKNNEKAYINKAVFIIGKDKTCADFIILGNSAISRIHAEVHTKKGEYFIMDKSSTNHTYLDNERIESEVEVKISHGERIKFGDEEFEFKLF